MKPISLTFELALITSTALSATLSKHSQSFGSYAWNSLPEVGTGPVQEHGAAATNDDLFIIGGISANTTAPIPPSRRDISAYNFETSTWRSVAPFPLTMGTTHANAATVDGKIYVLGGLTGTDSWQHTNTCFIYDPEADAWASLPSMTEDQGRGASAVGVHGSTVYLAGGAQVYSFMPNRSESSVDIVTSYNTRTGEWQTLTPLPGRRDHVGGAVIGSTFFVVGGRDNGHPNTRNNTWAMDLGAVEKGWVAKSDMPTARAGFAIGVVGNRYIVALGGEGNPADSSGVFPQTEVYDTIMDNWIKLESMVVPRHGLAAASVGDSIFLAGGGRLEAGGDPSDVFNSFTLL